MSGIEPTRLELRLPLNLPPEPPRSDALLDGRALLVEEVLGQVMTRQRQLHVGLSSHDDLVLPPHDVGQGLDVEIGVAELLHPAHQLAKRGKINERMKEGASKPVPHDEVSAGRPQQVIYRRGRQRHVTKILRDNLLTVRVA